MTKNYIVTGAKVRFGPGFILSLSKDQAALRSHVLHHEKGKNYAVLDTVEFKQGETIGISEGDIPKSWWDTLEEVDTKKPKTKEPEPNPDLDLPVAGEYSIKHRHFGKYDVLDSDGKVLTEEPLPKEEAEALAEKLSNEAEA